MTRSLVPPPLRRLAVLSRRRVRRSRLLQIGVVAAFWLAGEALVRTTGLPVPGGIVGLALAFAALAARRLPVATMKRGADWFLAEMLLFFVPAVLVVLDHGELVGLLGVKILAVIVLSTAAVMGATALTVDLCYRWTERHDHARLAD
ncbi:CidA/LrgA family protein [Rhodoplanes sp. TEM]|uniref:CidA/LrgA family protein n=1 Tax=Rhodoplanes tepidamans TaxID=200616 RepID=A0ABT5JHP4_RHOTP|nr:MULTISPECIES: CidA/LrgA family protein [Rhodoplanes]MDC7789234.1 CidA/LrgA family protein [Rhodoplanes tepidamans]MDC7985828.1 CidA/LrgA family protein [Rhodoplanes sp. TEM]MDQ0358845.1 holin-like protein [Rhodoplanes tepidamans]